jgi:hypothetical protein
MICGIANIISKHYLKFKPKAKITNFANLLGDFSIDFADERSLNYTINQKYVKPKLKVIVNDLTLVC